MGYGQQFLMCPIPEQFQQVKLATRQCPGWWLRPQLRHQMCWSFCCCLWDVGAATSCWGACGVASMIPLPPICLVWLSGRSIGAGGLCAGIRLYAPMGGRLLVGGRAVQVPLLPRYPRPRPRVRVVACLYAVYPPSYAYGCCVVGATGTGCPPTALTVATAAWRSVTIICCIVATVASKRLTFAWYFAMSVVVGVAVAGCADSLAFRSPISAATVSASKVVGF